MVRSLLMGTARLATVVSQGPMYVTFPASERDVIACKSGGKNEHLPIHIKLADGTIYSHPDITSFIDVQVVERVMSETLRQTGGFIEIVR
jgi:hypothetical protein